MTTEAIQFNNRSKATPFGVKNMNATELDDGLTAEEREALSEEEGAGTESTQNANAGVGADDAEAAATKAAADAAALEAAQNADATGGDAGAQSAAAQPAAAEQIATEAKQQSSPVLVATIPADVEVKLAEIGTKKSALLDNFDNGDITARDYQLQLDALAKEERVIERQQDRADLASQMEKQRLQNEWTATCNKFVESNSSYQEMPWLYMQLDAKVRELAVKPETVNWSGQKFLDEAHKELAVKYKLPAEGTQAAPKAADRGRPTDNLPPNLARVPAAQIEDTSGGQFAVLDRMANTDPIAYEEALNKMPAAQREAYLSA